jgi:hypothetical protein
VALPSNRKSGRKRSSKRMCLQMQRTQIKLDTKLPESYTGITSRTRRKSFLLGAANLKAHYVHYDKKV